MIPKTKIAQAIMQYVYEETNALGFRIVHYAVDCEDIERVVAERTGARKTVVHAAIEALIISDSLVSRFLGGGMVSLK